MEIEDALFVEDDLDMLDIIEFGFPRRRNVRSDYLHDMDELSFFKRFRLTKPTVLHVLQHIEEDLEFQNNLNDSISPINQLLCALRFYASAGHQVSIADFMGLHQTTASRIITKVSRAIANLRPLYIRMPEGNELLTTQEEFFRIARFPRVVGCIDGTHIKIQSPGGEDAEVFRNRKTYFSINTQVVGNSNLRINDIVARWPGSTHDATIYNNSRIRARFEMNEFPNSILLGDSGYPQREYFLTPLLHPITRPQQLYNESHIRTRNCVERLFGVWKRRFPVIAYGLRCKVETSLAIIVATAVLHNIAIAMNEREPPAPVDIDAHALQEVIDEGRIPQPQPYNANERAYNYRVELINNYFAYL